MIETFILYNCIMLSSSLWVLISRKNHKNFFLITASILVFFIFFVPSVIRYNIGADYWSYVNIYEKFKVYGEIGQEFGFEVLLRFLRFFDFDAFYLFFFSSLLIYFPLFFYSNKDYRPVLIFGYCCFFYLVSYNLIRSAIALSFIVVFFEDYIKNGFRFRQWIYFLIAFFFHKTSLLLVFFIPFALLNVNLIVLGKKRIVLFCFVLFFSYIKSDLIFIVFEDFLFILQMLSYDYYVNSSYLESLNSKISLGFILKLSLIMLSFFYMKNVPERMARVLCFAGFFVAFSSILMLSIDIFSRLERFFIFAYFYALVVVFVSKGKYRRMFILYFIFVSIVNYNNAIFSWRSDVCKGSRISPYVSIFNKNDDRSLSGIRQEECI